jgi:flagella synthesis protein FlgN
MSTARPSHAAQPAPRASTTAAPLAQPVLAQLLRDAQADLLDYGVLADLLQQQFDSALQHDAAPLEALAPQIVAIVDTLEQRRRTRERLVAQLLGAQTPLSMAALIERLPAAHRAPVQALWDRLEQAVRDCKALNARNARLMTEQQALLQRVLHGTPEPLYANP